MTVSVTCSHCHALNLIAARVLRAGNSDAPVAVKVAYPVTCRKCGHRADLPRMYCDCAKCTPVAQAAAEAN
jgi:hypothetical protein